MIVVAMIIRQPIGVLMGHIDHGKSSILEKIRGTSITKGEAGLITQSLKSYTIPFSVIQQMCGELLKGLKTELTIPGLLFLDSPGHAAFTNMRKIGGNLADIAILVIDVKEGVKDQTKECLAILKQYKTPFVIALNKIDALPGWQSHSKERLLASIGEQSSRVQEELDRILYELVGKLAEDEFNAERFDRVDDFTKHVAIVPVSAKTGEGLPELLMMVTGLAQRFLEKRLAVDIEGPGKATILEVTEESGLGTVLDVVLYDGALQVHDEIMFATLGKPVSTKIRGLFELDFATKKMVSRKIVHAAAGVKVIAPHLKEALGGMPLVVVKGSKAALQEELQHEVHSVIKDTGKKGIIAKADTLGSLEALAGLFKDAGIPVKKFAIGHVTKKDISELLVEKDPVHKVILGFNVDPLEGSTVKQITHDVIYKIIEDYNMWKEEQLKLLQAKEIEGVTRPFKIKFLPGFVFRQSNPAVIGAVVQGGTLTQDVHLMKSDGSKVSLVKTVQEEGKIIQRAGKDKEVAVAIPHVIVGRQLKEGDILYSDLTEEEFKTLKRLKKYLTPDEIEVVKEIAEIKRQQNPVWGV
jgi:translation initiation factor 5B